MKYLLDTHVLLWTLDESSNLSVSAREIIENSDDLYISIVSFWEIAIKKNLHRLEVNGTIQEMYDNCLKLSIKILNIFPTHLDALQELETFHKDPFDRILIAQAKIEDMILITRDSIIPKYNVSVLW